jgi:hypothetical protein
VSPDFPQPKAREVSDEEARELVHVAFELEREIKACVNQIHVDTWALAKALYEFREHGTHKLLGYETLEEFLGQPEIGISRSWFMALANMWRDLVVVRQVSPGRLEGIEPTKVRETMRAIRAGDVHPEKALDDAAALSRSDVIEKYQPANIARHGQSPDDSTPLDASAEPERIRCPLCDGWTTEDVIEGKGREVGS